MLGNSVWCVKETVSLDESEALFIRINNTINTLSRK